MVSEFFVVDVLSYCLHYTTAVQMHFQKTLSYKDNARAAALSSTKVPSELWQKLEPKLKSDDKHVIGPYLNTLEFASSCLSLPLPILLS